MHHVHAQPVACTHGEAHVRVVADRQLVYRRQEAVPELLVPAVGSRGAVVHRLVEVREGAAVLAQVWSEHHQAGGDGAPVQPRDGGVEDGGGRLGVRQLVEALGEDDVVVEHDDLVELRHRERAELIERLLVPLARPPRRLEEAGTIGVQPL